MPAWKTETMAKRQQGPILAAMLGNRSYLDDIRFKIGRYLGNEFDVDPKADWFKPGNTPVQKAFQQSKNGLELLLVFIEPDQFPSLDRTSRRHGAKLIKRNLLHIGAVQGPYLGQALAALMAKTQGRLRFDEPIPEGDLGSSAYYVRLRAMIQDFYPALPATSTLLDETAPAEFEVLETGEPREAVRSGEEAGSGYSAALLRGENPNEDPALVKEQWEYARDFFICGCEVAAVHSAMDRPRRTRFVFEDVVADLINFTTPESGGPQGDPKRLAYRAQALKRWEPSVRSFLSYAALDATAAGTVTAPADRT
jgi:hypothetical protein